VLVSSGCEQKMADQPRYDPLEPSRLFTDGMSARPVIAETVARGELPEDSLFVTGIADDVGKGEFQPSLIGSVSYSDSFPLPVDADLMERGRGRYGIYCAPCHGSDGMGAGAVVKFGYPKAQSFHTDRLKRAPVGYLYDVATRGYQNMPSFGNRIPPRDCWAIIVYIRALQLASDTGADRATQEVDELLPVSENGTQSTERREREIPTDAGSGRFIDMSEHD
jgi:mono/diheme cytochrome c family protein